MSEPEGRNTVLIVDDDVAFVWWLGETFTEAGYQAVPALNPTQACTFISKFQVNVNILIVNQTLAGAGRLVKLLGKPERDVKVVLIEDDRSSKASKLPHDATLRRPSSWEPVSREDWLRKLRTLLKQVEAAPHRIK